MKRFEFIQEGCLWIHWDYHALLKGHGLNRFDALYDLSGGELFKQNRYRSVDRIYLQGEDGRSHIFHLKRHHPPLLARIRSVFTGFRIKDGAENEWGKILRLEEVGIRTMTPVAFGAFRKWGLPYQALTLTEHLYGAEKLEDYLPSHFGEGALSRDKITRKRRIIKETGKWARTFHKAGFHHQDFYLGHIFIKPGQGEDFTLHLIDLQRVREYKRLQRSMVIKDLAQINFSASQLSCLTRTDRLRFLKIYLGKKRLGRSEKDLIRSIEKKTRRISSHTKKLLARRVNQRPIRQTSLGMKNKSRTKAPF